MKDKSKITGLKAKSMVSMNMGKDPKTAITGLKVKSVVDMPSPKKGKPTLKAKSKM